MHMTKSNDLITLITANDWNKRYPALPEDIRKLEDIFGTLPGDYKALLEFSDGGSIYDHKVPLIIYSISEVMGIFRDEELYTYIPESLIFGGDGGGIIYCFDLRPGKDKRVFFTSEQEAWFEPNVYNVLRYEGTTLTDTIQRIINNEKLI
jgi:hypothetical protein